MRMQQYSKQTKRKIDLADAAPYWLANETGLTEILTFDIAYQTGKRSPCWNSTSRECVTLKAATVIPDACLKQTMNED
jgi:hypothetical protein